MVKRNINSENFHREKNVKESCPLNFIFVKRPFGKVFHIQHSFPGSITFVAYKSFRLMLAVRIQKVHAWKSKELHFIKLPGCLLIFFSSAITIIFLYLLWCSLLTLYYLLEYKLLFRISFSYFGMQRIIKNEEYQ